MSAPSQYECLQLMVARLRASAALVALVPAANIVNHRPQIEDAYPAILVRWSGSGPFDTKDSAGFDGSFEMDIWTDQHGDADVLKIMDILHVLCHNVVFNTAVSGQSLLLRYRESRLLVEDGVSHHGVISFTHIFTE